MTTEELIQPLNYLEENEKKHNNDEIVDWFQETRAACSNMLGANDIILELKQTLEADQQSENTPYHHILLAYAYYRLGDLDTAIKFSNMSVRYFNSRGMDWHQSMSHWFLGILLCKQGELDKAKTETDHAINILVKLEKEDERLGYYKNTHKKQINTIKDSHASAIIKITAAGCALFDGEIIVQNEVFSGIINRIKIDKDDSLNSLRQEVCELNPSDLPQMDERFSRLDSILKDKRESYENNEKRIVTNPYLYIFLAHCYNFRSYKKEAQHPLALRLVWNAIKGFQSSSGSLDHELNKHNQALSCWYLGLLYHNRGDYYSYRIQLEKARLLFTELQQLHDGIKVDEIQIIEEYLVKHESSKAWSQNLLNKPEIQKPVLDQKPPYHFLRFMHNRREADRNPSGPQDTPIKDSTMQQDTQFKRKKSSNSNNVPPPTVPATKPPPESNNSHLRHIIIPVDVRAIEELNINSIPLEPEFFEKLKTYEEKKEHHEEQENNDNPDTNISG